MRTIGLAAAVLLLASTVYGTQWDAPSDRFLAASSWGSGVPTARLIVTLENRTNCGPGDTAPPNRVDTADRVNNLISEMKKSNYDAFIVPTTDEHQSEFVPDPDRRRAYISGFSGSAGYAVVLSDGQRALWTDGRYFMQADDELDCNWLLMKEQLPGVPTLLQFLKDTLPAGSVVAADPKLIGYGSLNALEDGLQQSSITMEQSTTNPVDTVWDADTDNPRPAYGTDSAWVYGDYFAGKSLDEKLEDVRAHITAESAQALVITTLEETAWLLNVRGNDIAYNPVVRSYTIVTLNSATWYLDQRKVTPEILDHLGNSVTVSDYETVWPDLEALTLDPSTQSIMLPDDSVAPGCSYKIYDTVPEAKRLLAISPTLMMKAEMTPIEITMMREALIRNGAALSDFLAELERRMNQGIKMTEVAAQDLLTTYRAAQEVFVELSFATTSAYGPHGAIIHYISTPLTDVEIGTDNLYLLDSGGQYFGATIDVTRNLHYGTPTPEMVEMYTRVLMGVIDFASLKFPTGQKSRMDVVARRAIYEKGLDYRHGTSHGIGACLLVDGEPGYYKDGECGIRTENQLVVVDTGMVFDSPFYGLDTISLAPFEPKLIDPALLSPDQIDWLNAYNLAIRNDVGSEMVAQNLMDGYNWLLSKTEPITVVTPPGKKSFSSSWRAFWQKLFQRTTL